MMSKIRKMETKLRFKGELDKLLIFANEPYYVTEMPRNAKGQMVFVVDQHTDTGWGDDRLCFTGMFSILLTEEELIENFELWEEL